MIAPELSIHSGGKVFEEGPGAAEAPSSGPVEGSWLIYYKPIFNPARLKIGSMPAHAGKYWRNMPEASLVLPAIVGAQPGVGDDRSL